MKLTKGQSNLNVVGTTAGMVAAAFMSLYGMLSPKIDAQTEKFQKDHDAVVLITSAVADIPAIKNDISSMREDAAATRQLIHDLSESRFQYNPTQSEQNGIKKIASSTTTTSPISLK